MHMRFLSRGFKNLQWYSMTYRVFITNLSYERSIFYLLVSLLCMEQVLCLLFCSMRI